MIFLNDHNEEVRLGPALASGGEGAVHPIDGQPDKIAKLYHARKLLGSELAEKLQVMIANPPADPMKAYGHMSIAWPESRLFLKGRFAGFVMPRAIQAHKIIEFYSPAIRQKHHSGVTWKNLHAIGRNLATAMAALHVRNYVIGDVNEGNIVVNDMSLVTLIDTDSFQVRDPQTGRLFRCHVGKGEFTPAELQGKDLRTADRYAFHDLFGLGVLLFQLLMEGNHPFTGISRTQASVSGVTVYEHNIGQGNFPYDPEGSFAPPLAAPEFSALHPPIQALFKRCFVDGHKKPTARPAALEWYQEIVMAESLLQQCQVNPQHWYSPHVSECPWCEREKALRVIAEVSKSWSITELGVPLQTPSPHAPLLAPPQPAANKPPVRKSRRSRSELRLEAVAPETVVVNRPFTLVVAVRRPESPPLQLDVPNQRADEIVRVWSPNSRAGKVSWVELQVRVLAPECVIIGKPFEMIRLRQGRDSQILYFTLRPLQAGKIFIHVTLHQAFIFVGSVRVTSMAGVHADGEAHTFHSDLLHLPQVLDETNGAYSLLVKAFDMDELQTLCRELGIDFEELPGEIKQRKAASLVAYAHRHGRAGDLMAAIMAARPNWMDLI